MPQDVFDIGALTITKLNLGYDAPIAQVAAELADGYRNTYIDDDYAGNWLSVVPRIIVVLRASSPKADDQLLAGFCAQLQYCVKNFNLDGSKRRRAIFGGALFNKERTSIENRMENCVRSVKIFTIGSIAGTFTLAPSGWKL